MDRAPRPELPDEPEIEQQLKRKKRFLDRFRGLGDASEGEFDLGERQDDNEARPFGEFWSRDSESLASEDETLGFIEADSPLGRVQQLGRGVLEQSRAVHGFAQSLNETIDDLPKASREAVKPEAERLQSATGELQEAAEELDEELEEFEQVAAEPSAEQPVAAPVIESAAPEKAKPKRDMSEALGMARLVIATLIGGGLGVLVGEGRKKERRAVAEKAKADNTIEQQKAKIAEQDAELQKLRLEKPAAGVEPKKEFIKKTSELTERQVELTHTTVEQVKAATQQAVESERTFKIPEQQKPEPERSNHERAVDTDERVERFEEQHERPVENQDKRNEQPQAQPIWAQGFSPNKTYGQQSSPVFQQPKPKLGISSPRTWTYGAFLAAAIAIALGLLIFGPK